MNLKSLFKLNEMTYPLNDGEVDAIITVCRWIVAHAQTGRVPNEITRLASELMKTASAARGVR